MIRLLAASLFLAVAAAPGFACEFQKSVSTDMQKRTVASQPADNQSPPPPNATAERKQS